MDVGIHIPSFQWPDGPPRIAADLARLASTAEEVGFTSVSVMDHYFQMQGFLPVEDPMLEAYATLGFLAGQTSKVRLRTLVSGVTYRHPGLLAKIVSTLDVLSEGRAELGIGAAWYEREHRGLGVEFPRVGERFRRLEETLRICLQMWSDDNGPFEGRYYQLGETLCSPRPLQQPHPPIMIGGTGEQKTLLLVARYADACNITARDISTVAHKLDVLRGHCEREGRDYASIRKTILYSGQALARGDDSAFVEEMREYGAIGVQEVIVMPVGPHALDFVHRLGTQVIRQVAAL
ncbi:MAG: LLM class F420-dependent oxidoreductase [Dehalococcoidia bacterium]|nr:MAG: LLM class F420-dependent oxidoreductase [Dehalococcoidia bacterium]